MSLKRTDLKEKVIDSSEVLSVIDSLPGVGPLVNALHECRYRDFMAGPHLLTKIFSSTVSRLSSFSSSSCACPSCVSSSASFSSFSSFSCFSSSSSSSSSSLSSSSSSSYSSSSSSSSSFSSVIPLASSYLTCTTCVKLKITLK